MRRSPVVNDHTPNRWPALARPADLPLILESLLADIESARAEGQPDAALVAEYLALRERA